MEKEKLNKILAQADLEYELLKDKARESEEWQKLYLKEKRKNSEAIRLLKYEIGSCKKVEDDYLEVDDIYFIDKLLNILEEK